MYIDLQKIHRSYSAQAVMEIYGISHKQLKRFERWGKLKLVNNGELILGYPAEQVEALARYLKRDMKEPFRSVQSCNKGDR